MELAQALRLLWRKKIWLAVGVLVALVAGVVSDQLLKKQEYATASTQMIVESPRSPLGNASASLVPFTARAGVFAGLMTSHSALVAIGQAAGIPANQIVASAPSSAEAATIVSPPPPAGPRPTKYKLFLDQDPALPTVDIYAQAPSTKQAIALANGAVTGFSSYLGSLENQTATSPSARVEVRALGGAVGGRVDPGASTKIAAVIALLVVLIWCAVILYLDPARRRGLGAVRPPMAAGDGVLFQNGLPYGLTRGEAAGARETTIFLPRSANSSNRGGAPNGNGHNGDPGAALTELAGRSGELADPFRDAP